MTDKNSLVYWFPKLLDAGIPVPRTEIIPIHDSVAKFMRDWLDGKAEDLSPMNQIVDQVARAAEPFVCPSFLRTSHTSNKHSWKFSCFIDNELLLAGQMLRLVEFSECAGMLGIPWTHFVVRELLPTIVVATLPQYDFMPLAKEVRCFVHEGRMLCHHNYWPLESIRQGLDTEHRHLAEGLFKEVSDVNLMDFLGIVNRVAQVFKDDEAFSVDLLPTEIGWFVTDMALAHRSWHWPDCPNVFRQKGNMDV